MKFLGSFILFLWCGQVLASTSLSLNDVSILLPLPKHEADNDLLLNPLSGNTLLPKSHYYSLPALLPDIHSETIYHDLLRVVAVRIDPCFIEGEGPQNCRQQIRMVWQPISMNQQGYHTHDATIHTFYDVKNEEWGQLLSHWKTLRKTSEASLQVHPILVKEGYQGEFWSRLRELILSYCSEKNLSRVTSMNLVMGEQMWIFSAFDVQEGERKEIMIPRIGRSRQGVIMSTGNLEEFTGSIRPPPSTDLELSALLQDSIAMKNNEAEVKQVMHRVFEYENPNIHNPGTLDCVSCHVAQSVRLWGQKNFSHWDWASTFKGERYDAPLSPAVLKTNRFRVFGYFYDEPVISQRVVNETLEVLKIFD